MNEQMKNSYLFLYMLEYDNIGSAKQDGCILMDALVGDNRVFWQKLTIIAKLVPNLLK